ncbi:MAG: nucleotidyltransferase domain-containing protein [Nanobdellota archaeon]
MNLGIDLPELFASKNTSLIIKFFLDNPDIEISQIELLRKVRVAKGTGIKCLKKLVEYGMVGYKKLGVMHLYYLENEKPFVKQMKVLNNLLKLQELNSLKEDVEIFLYGSCARGEEGKDSDIDLLIIGNIRRHKIINTIEKLSKKIGKSLNFRIFTQIEWSMLQKKDKPFYERVEKDKIRVK